MKISCRHNLSCRPFQSSYSRFQVSASTCPTSEENIRSPGTVGKMGESLLNEAFPELGSSPYNDRFVKYIHGKAIYYTTLE